MNNAMKHILTFAALAAVLLTAAGCSSNDDSDNPGNGDDISLSSLKNKPNWKTTPPAQDVDYPNWEASPDLNPASSMTATLAFANDGSMLKNLTQDDYVAAFCDDECIGVARANMNDVMERFYLYMHQPAGKSGVIALAYYSSKERKIYYWPYAFTYANDRIIGTFYNPFILSENPIDQAQFPYETSIIFEIPKTICDNFRKYDELAIFMGDECRLSTTKSGLISDNGSTFFTDFLPFNSRSEQFVIRYYSSKDDCIYTSPAYKLNDEGAWNIPLIELHK